MVLVFLDHERLPVHPEAGHLLQSKSAEAGISSGSVIVVACPENGENGRLLWKFDGCPEVEVTFPRAELENIDGAERIATRFVERWRETFATPPESCSRQSCAAHATAIRSEMR